MAQNDELIGVIYALPRHIIDRVLVDKKKVFIKYIAKEPIKKTRFRISPGNKLFLYESGGKKIIVGESLIKKCEFLNKDEVYEKYRIDLILTKKELDEYAIGREEKKLLVLHLEKIETYEEPIKLNKQITMAGHYVTFDNINILVEDDKIERD